MAQRPRAGLFARALVLCTLPVIAPLAGCSDDGTLSNVRPFMVLDPEAGTRIGFSEVVLGRTEAPPRVIGVSNVGEGSLQIQRVTVDGPGAAAFRVSSFPRTVVPGARKEIYVRFEPTEKIDAEATLHITSNDPRLPEVSFPLSGPAREPCRLQISPPHSGFLLGQIRPIQVTAAGTQDCKVTYLFTDSTLFPFVDPPEVPFVIPAGTTTELRVQHAGLPTLPGVPIRRIRAKESEGTEVEVSIEGEPPISGCLSVYPDRLVFDQTVIDHTSEQRVVVHNRCSREAYVTSGIITIGPYYYDVDEASFPILVPPAGDADVWVTYNPFSPLGDDGLLLLNTNDASFPRFPIELFGTAAVPDLDFFPKLLDFGTVVFKNPSGPTGRSECSSNSQFVQIYNAGTAELTISRMELDPAGDHDFEINGVLVDGLPVADFRQAINVPSGKDAKISIQFHPTREVPAEHRSKLTVFHNAINDPPAEVTLIGYGADDGATTDVFTQLTGPKVDILWVIDNSCSMFNEQAALIGNMSQFVGYADSQNADYQMAVITTDGHSPVSGIFEDCFPFPRVISSSWGTDQERQDAFRCLFDVGTNGSGKEAGLAAAKHALERAQSLDQDPVSNRNAGFLRPDAKLTIVAMSDEEDQSDEGDQLLRDYFLSVKGSDRPDRMRFHAIGGPVAEPCNSPDRMQPMPAYRYFWMTNELSGQFQNICAQDWQPLLQNIGLETFTPLDEWDLSQSADPSSLVVTIDGVPVPRGATDGFTYNASANSVQFHGTSLPPPGAEITVDYVGLCRP